MDYLEKHKKLSLDDETIYQLIYDDKAEGGDLYMHLRVVYEAVSEALWAL